jgi:hypothetical protein
MVRDTVAMETFARAATVRISGVFPAAFCFAFRTTKRSSPKLF